MKMIITAIAMLAVSQANADWEDVFQNPDLSSNWEGYVTQSSATVDPVAKAYPGNHDLFVGHEAGDAINLGARPSSLDYISQGNPDLDNCGCI